MQGSFVALYADGFKRVMICVMHQYNHVFLFIRRSGRKSFINVYIVHLHSITLRSNMSCVITYVKYNMNDMYKDSSNL